MIPLEEGYHVYNSIMKETGIDPHNREDEIRVNESWAIAKANLGKAAHAELDQNTKAGNAPTHSARRRQRRVAEVQTEPERDTDLIEAVAPKAVPRRRSTPRTRGGQASTDQSGQLPEGSS